MSNFTNIIENTELGIFINSFISFNKRYKDDIALLRKGVLRPEDSNELTGIFYQLALKTWGLSIFGNTSNIDLAKFKSDFTSLCTTNSLTSLLRNIFDAYQIIITNPAPAIINITIKNPQQLKFKEYVDTETETENYITLNDPDSKYITRDLGNFVGDTSSNLFKDLIKQFISSTVKIGDIQIVNVILIFIPDLLLKTYLKTFVVSEEIETGQAESNVFETLLINNVGIEDLTGLQAFTGCKDLTLSGLSLVDNFNPVYQLPLEDFNIIDCVNFDVNDFVNVSALKNITLDNTNTTSLDFLTSNTTLESFAMSNNANFITDFRGLGNKLSLQPISVANNVFFGTIELVGGDLIFDSGDAYDIDGNILPINPTSVNNGGVINGNIITWTGASASLMYSFNKEGLKGEIMTYNLNVATILEIPNPRFKAFLNNILGQDPDADITSAQALDPIFNTLYVPDLQPDLEADADINIFIGLENFTNIEELTLDMRKYVGMSSSGNLNILYSTNQSQLPHLTNLKKLTVNVLGTRSINFLQGVTKKLLETNNVFDTMIINANGTLSPFGDSAMLIDSTYSNPITFTFDSFKGDLTALNDKIAAIQAAHPNWVFNVLNFIPTVEE